MRAQNSQVTLAALFLLLISFSVAAIESARLQIGSLHGANIDSSQLDITFSLDKNGLAMQATAEEFTLADQVLSNVTLNCQRFKVATKFWQCQQGTLQFTHALLGQQHVALSFTANTLTKDYQLEIAKLGLASGQLQLSLQLKDKQWQSTLNVQQLDASSMLTLLTEILPNRDLTMISSWQPKGVVSGTADLTGNGSQLVNADIKLSSPNFSFSDNTGNHVAETLDFALELTATAQQKDWQFQAALALNNGQSYWAPIFLDFQQTPLDLSLKGVMQPANQRWQLRDIKLEHQGVLSAKAVLQIQNKQLQQLEMTLKPSPLSTIYKWWLQPFVPATAAANLTTDGQIAGHLEWQKNHLQFQADLQQLTIKDNEGRFAINGLDGRFAWTTGPDAVPLHLNWQQIMIGALPIDASSLQAEVANNQLTLTKMLELPLLDGGLQISDFNYQHATTGSSWQFEGLLKPLSMQALTNALGWPEMDGKLSGVIPRVSYQNQQIDIDGALLVKVFDGTTVIKDLKLQSPFGSLPQLYGNIDMQQIDLELLTRTFDFGKISGRLNGSITDLRLSNWQPVQFDARFATPENNPGKRRISQRAVDNLSQIGGGASGLMSRSFLRFFEDFSYDKLGIRCQLKNDVCLMSGIEDDEQGYYIVKGGGLPPWINVKGFTRRVDWPELVARLQAVKNSDGPIIQ
ncbi:MAG TPA: hypothetical protein VFM76_02955 [Methylophaga sp.]|nr:hypothetical protein [Methylophaga sp.]